MEECVWRVLRNRQATECCLVMMAYAVTTSTVLFGIQSIDQLAGVFAHHADLSLAPRKALALEFD
jgi:hypothetical protein